MVSIEVLKGFDLFAGLSDDELGNIAKVATEHVYEKGTLCFAEGGKAENLELVRGGQVAIEFNIRRLSQHKKVTIMVLGPGRVFGWSAVVEPGILTASARCVERAQIIKMRATDLIDIFEKNSHTGYVVMKNLAATISSRLRHTREKLALRMPGADQTDATLC